MKPATRSADLLPPLSDRARHLAVGLAEPARSALVALADEADAAVAAWAKATDAERTRTMVVAVGTWARLRRRWGELTGEPML